jgi:hypothetical protein
MSEGRQIEEWSQDVEPCTYVALVVSQFSAEMSNKYKKEIF